MGGGCSLFVGGQHKVTGDALPSRAEMFHHRTPLVGIEGHPAHQNDTQKQRLVLSMQAATSRLLFVGSCVSLVGCCVEGRNPFGLGAAVPSTNDATGATHIQTLLRIHTLK